MAIKRNVSIVIAVCMAMGLMVPTLNVDAAGLTQARDASVVNYGMLTDKDIAILRSIFDYDYYKKMNPELVETIGDNYENLFLHFCQFGVFEGRPCNSNFDPSAYASAYTDLRDAFGKDIIKYYEHYILYSENEGRDITTLEECAISGIIVHPLNNDKIQITPSIYWKAEHLGITDVESLTTFAGAVEGAQSSGETLVVADIDASPELLEAQGLQKVGSISVKDGEHQYTKSVGLFIVKGNTGYAGYFRHVTETTSDGITYYDFNRENTDENTPDYKTSDYTRPDGNYLDPFASIEFYIVCIPGVGYYNMQNRFDYIDEMDEHYTVKGELPQKEYVETKTFCRTWDETTYAVGDDGYLGMNGKIEYTTVTSNNNATNQITCDGIKTNDGTVRDFENLEEKNEVMKNSIYVGTYTDNSNGQQYWGDTICYDVNGTEETVYDIGLNIEDGDDGIHITTGISNEDNNYGHVEEFVISSEWEPLDETNE